MVERAFCSNPPQKPQKGDYIHLVDFLLRRNCMKKVALLGGCSSRVLGGLLRINAVSGGDIRLKSGGLPRRSYCCRSTENGDLARTAKT